MPLCEAVWFVVVVQMLCGVGKKMKHKRKYACTQDSTEFCVTYVAAITVDVVWW